MSVPAPETAYHPQPDQHQVVYERTRKTRSGKGELPAQLRWDCPNGCGKVLKKTSFASIQQHQAHCDDFVRKITAKAMSTGLENDGSSQTAVKGINPGPSSKHSGSVNIVEYKRDGSRVEHVVVPQASESAQSSLSTQQKERKKNAKANLPEQMIWKCPNDCGKILKRTSLASINSHKISCDAFVRKIRGPNHPLNKLMPPPPGIYIYI